MLASQLDCQIFETVLQQDSLNHSRWRERICRKTCSTRCISGCLGREIALDFFGHPRHVEPERDRAERRPRHKWFRLNAEARCSAVMGAPNESSLTTTAYTIAVAPLRGLAPQNSTADLWSTARRRTRTSASKWRIPRVPRQNPDQCDDRHYRGEHRERMAHELRGCDRHHQQ